MVSLNPFPHIDAFWRFCSRRLFENKFLLLPQCFPLLVIGYTFNYRDLSICWQNMFKVFCCSIVVWDKGLKRITRLSALFYLVYVYKLSTLFIRFGRRKVGLDDMLYAVIRSVSHDNACIRCNIHITYFCICDTCNITWPNHYLCIHPRMFKKMD